MSLRLRILNVGLRYVVRRRLLRTKTPEAAERDFARVAPWVFRRPPFLRHLKRTGPVTSHWVSIGAYPSRKIILYFHGGAYIAGSGETHLSLLGRLAKLSGIEICAPDYRLLQDAPFPAAFDDALAIWDDLIAKGYPPSGIVLGGDSAGGGLALALLSKLCQRGQRPAAAFAIGPWTDMTLSGDSVAENARNDVLLPVARMQDVVEQYLQGADPKDPRCSPHFAEFDAPPPVLIHVGKQEVLLSDSLRVAEKIEKSGGRINHRVFDKRPHVWHIFDGWIPESRPAIKDIAAFVQMSLAVDKR